MTAPIATARSVPEMLAAFQLRQRQLQATNGEVEHVILATRGHLSQIFRPNPEKNLSDSMFQNLNTQYEVMWIMVEDPVPAGRFVKRLQKAASPGMLNIGQQKVTVVKLTRRRMQKLGKLGTKGRMKKMTPAARRKVARKAANARWHPAPPPQQLPRSGLPVSGPAHLTNAERRKLANGGEKS